MNSQQTNYSKYITELQSLNPTDPDLFRKVKAIEYKYKYLLKEKQQMNIFDPYWMMGNFFDKINLDIYDAKLSKLPNSNQSHYNYSLVSTHIDSTGHKKTKSLHKEKHIIDGKKTQKKELIYGDKIYREEIFPDGKKTISTNFKHPKNSLKTN